MGSMRKDSLVEGRLQVALLEDYDAIVAVAKIPARSSMTGWNIVQTCLAVEKRHVVRQLCDCIAASEVLETLVEIVLASVWSQTSARNEIVYL
jgi:hypothetical protein